MKIGITGLPQSGKKTLFKLLTGLEPARTTIGVSKWADPRLDYLFNLYNARKKNYAEVEYVLVPAITALEAEKNAVLGQLLNLDTFIFLARSFEDESVYHLNGSVDCERDVKDFVSDLIFRDLVFTEKRIENLSLDIRKKPTDEKKKELSIVKKIRENLEKSVFVRVMPLLPEEKSVVSSYQFLTDKKFLVMLNTGEKAPGAGLSGVAGQENFTVLSVPVKAEYEISTLDDEQLKNEFLKELSIREPASARALMACFEVLDLICFFTTVSGEVRAWQLRRNSPVLKAAGTVHADMEKGFIRAEVIKLADLIKHGSEQKVKEAGLFYVKGRDYIVEDADVITFRFNV